MVCHCTIRAKKERSTLLDFLIIVWYYFENVYRVLSLKDVCDLPGICIYTSDSEFVLKRTTPGEQGEQGEPGAFPTVYEVSETLFIGPHTLGNQTVFCDDGDTRIGGGITGIFGSVRVVTNGPFAGNGWIGAVLNTSLDSQTQVDVTVICSDTAVPAHVP